jgi:hypothetical protein
MATTSVLVDAIATVAGELALAVTEGADQQGLGPLGAELVVLGAQLAMTCGDDVVDQFEAILAARERCLNAL